MHVQVALASYTKDHRFILYGPPHPCEQWFIQLCNNGTSGCIANIGYLLFVQYREFLRLHSHFYIARNNRSYSQFLFKLFATNFSRRIGPFTWIGCPNGCLSPKTNLLFPFGWQASPVFFKAWFATYSTQSCHVAIAAELNNVCDPIK